MGLAIFTTEDRNGNRHGTDEDAHRIGRVENDTVIDVTDAVASFSDALERLSRGDLPTTGTEYERSTVDLQPPTTASNTIFAAALNYESHIAEKSESDAIDSADRGIPERPYLFLTLYRSLVGHGQPIQYYSSMTDQFDFAAELAAVIGTPARNVTPAEALDHVAGYTIFNDTAAYDIQNVAVGDNTWIDWFSAKSMESTSPLGPHVVGADEIEDPHKLDIHSAVNGQTMQNGSTASMIRGVDELVSFLSTRVTLEPGDVIATGTPQGVGAFQDVSLSNGDHIEIEIENVGTLSNVVEEQ